MKGSFTTHNIDLASTKIGIKTVDVGIFTRICEGANLATPTLAEKEVLAHSTLKFV